MFKELDRLKLEELATRIYAALYGCAPPEGEAPPPEAGNIVDIMCLHIEAMVAKTAEDMKRCRQQVDLLLHTRRALKQLCEDIGLPIAE